ncbi:hypothetical protein H4I96_08668 [Botrytis cinerea]
MPQSQASRHWKSPGRRLHHRPPEVSCMRKGRGIECVAVKHFVTQGIKFLDVKDCDKISPDAIEYARGRGVEVKFNFTEPTTAPNYRDRMIAL